MKFPYERSIVQTSYYSVQHNQKNITTILCEAFVFSERIQHENRHMWLHRVKTKTKDDDYLLSGLFAKNKR